MKSLIKNAVLLSVYHIAKETVTNIEAEMKKEDEKEVEEKDLKRKLMLVGTIHTLLGILYND
jgi:hypothetical protein